MKWLLFLTLFVLGLLSRATGQPGSWTQYNSVNSGLPFNSVRCIAFETDSSVWIGTDFGLGHLLQNGNWTIYGSWNSPLTDNSIRSLVIAKDGTKWIGTFTSGLYSFNDSTWSNYSSSNSPLSDDFVRSLAIDTAGTLWIGTIGGLNRLDTTGNWTLYTMWNSVLGSNNIACLFVDSATNDKWAGTVNGGLLYIQEDTLLTSFTIQNSGISDNTILGIDMDASGNLFLASPANGMIVKLNGFGWITSNTVTSNIPTAGLTCIQLDSIDEPWIGSIDHGLLHRNAGGFTYYDSSNSPLNDPVVQCLRIDPGGLIWIGTQSEGLFVFDPDLSTGVAGIRSPLSWDFHPNPVRDILRLDPARQTPVRIEILSVDGRILLTAIPVGSTVDISMLSCGTYLIRAVFAEGIGSLRKFVKE